MYWHSHRFAFVKLRLSKYIFVTLGGSNNQKTKLYNEATYQTKILLIWDVKSQTTTRVKSLFCLYNCLLFAFFSFSEPGRRPH